MLIGSFEHMLDAKGRVFIPAKWRDTIGEVLVVTLGLLETQTEQCLFGMSVPAWEAFSEKLSALPVSDAGGQAIAAGLSMGRLAKWMAGAYMLPAACARRRVGKGYDADRVGDRIELDPAAGRYNARASRVIDAMAHLAEMGI